MTDLPLRPDDEPPAFGYTIGRWTTMTWRGVPFDAHVQVEPGGKTVVVVYNPARHTVPDVVPLYWRAESFVSFEQATAAVFELVTAWVEAEQAKISQNLSDDAAGGATE